MECELCGNRRSIIEVGITYMSQAGKLKICAACSGIWMDPDGRSEHKSIEDMIYALQDKCAKMEAAQPPGQAPE